MSYFTSDYIISCLPMLNYEREGEKKTGDHKCPDPHLTLLPVKPIAYCQQAKYNRASSLKSATERLGVNMTNACPLMVDLHNIGNNF